MLSAWSTFYVMMGSSAAALTGLVFIVTTLIASRERERNTREAGLSTFTTPTVVHFAGALLTSAVMSVPFPSLVPVAVLTGLIGAAGMCYVLLIARRAAAMPSYRPDAEDWTWNCVLPFAAYLALVVGALAMHPAPAAALYAPALAAALLVFVGIHNAWDVVTFLALGKDQNISGG